MAWSLTEPVASTLFPSALRTQVPVNALSFWVSVQVVSMGLSETEPVTCQLPETSAAFAAWNEAMRIVAKRIERFIRAPCIVRNLNCTWADLSRVARCVTTEGQAYQQSPW